MFSKHCDGSPRIPRATYRLQFNRHFTLSDALGIVPYLDDLGISDIYASPLFQACEGSTHGYDVCDFTRLSSCLGTEADLEALAMALQERGMGLLLDMVPNHMGIGDPANVWWNDVLRNGQNSAFAGFFDIDWNSPAPGLRGKVLLPVLGDPFETVLERRDIKLAWREGEFRITYFEHSFPVSESGMAMLIDTVLKDSAVLGRKLSTGAAQARAKRFRQLVESDPSARDELQATLDRLNQGGEQNTDREALQRLLDLQHYRLAWWRAAAEKLNYRRFFDVTGLAGLRVENPDVFSATHNLVLGWLDQGKVTGLRVDHPDGLREPAEYFAWLQKHVALHSKSQAKESKPLYLVAEKILSPGEALPGDWLVHGTTGYDFLSDLNSLFVNPANAEAFNEIYADFIGARIDFEELIYSRKRFILESVLRAETEALARRLAVVAAAQGCEYSIDDWKRAIVEVIACLPVYRTYLSAERPTLSHDDKRFLHEAILGAKEHNSNLDTALFDFIARLFASPPDASALDLALRFQQLSGPATAKGVEDTSFYIYNRLISLNEVGGNPSAFGSDVQSFHNQNRARMETWPHSMLATSTHDTKRGEDTRARINVLSEIPDLWRAALARWGTLNAPKKTVVDGQPAPDANDEYLLYQTLLGAWPEEETPDLAAFSNRIKAYAIKAAKESKRYTNWIDPHQPYEDALTRFIDEVLAADSNFLEDFRRLQSLVACHGRFNSLAQTLLKITSPGVPDFYQGSELFNLSLVDPDNRQPVNFDVRKKVLAGIQELRDRNLPALLRELAASGFGERAKLFLTYAGLHFRRCHEDLFRQGNYVPLNVEGPNAEHVCAFARTTANQAAVIVAPRFTVKLFQGAKVPPTSGHMWKNCTLHLPSDAVYSKLENVFTGEVLNVRSRSLRLEDVFQSFPVALLECRAE